MQASLRNSGLASYNAFHVSCLGSLAVCKYFTAAKRAHAASGGARRCDGAPCAQLSAQGNHSNSIRDQDGNATGGVRLPDMAAPLGTHGGQNPPLSFKCSLGSSYLAFAKTKEEREAVSDSRPSLVERYKDRNDYVNRIRAGARDLEQHGFLLTEDSAIISYGPLK
jgi:Alpha/beta hydrolase domain